MAARVRALLAVPSRAHHEPGGGGRLSERSCLWRYFRIVAAGGSLRGIVCLSGQPGRVFAEDWQSRLEQDHWPPTICAFFASGIDDYGWAVPHSDQNDLPLGSWRVHEGFG